MLLAWSVSSHLFECAEFHAAIRQHGAPERRLSHVHASFRPDARQNALRRSSFGARDQRVFVFRTRRCRRRCDGRAWRLGSELHLVWPWWASRSRAYDSVAEFTGTFLRTVY